MYQLRSTIIARKLYKNRETHRIFRRKSTSDKNEMEEHKRKKKKRRPFQEFYFSFTISVFFPVHPHTYTKKRTTKRGQFDPQRGMFYMRSSKPLHFPLQGL